MKLIVGLGNPGLAYDNAKHNVGFWVVDLFAKRHNMVLSEKCASAMMGHGQIQGCDYLVAKPQTFMNRSGRAVGNLMCRFDVSLSDLIVVYDDRDLPCGQVRVRTSGRSGGHRGVASIIEALGAQAFLRVRVGIGKSESIDAAEDVLSPFSQSALRQVRLGVAQAAEAIEMLFGSSATSVMNRYNRRSV